MSSNPNQTNNGKSLSANSFPKPSFIKHMQRNM